MTAVFLSHYLSGPLPYVRRHITVNKNVLSASLNKTFPSFHLYTNTATYATHWKLRRQGAPHAACCACAPGQSTWWWPRSRPAADQWTDRWSDPWRCSAGRSGFESPGGTALSGSSRHTACSCTRCCCHNCHGYLHTGS